MKPKGTSCGAGALAREKPAAFWPRFYWETPFMNELAMQIKHAKVRGEWAELKFMAAAAEHGLHVTKPWGETTQYDFAVEHQSHFVRVQVKSTTAKHRGGYRCSVRTSRGPYRGDPFDFLAAYVVPEDVWFIIPERVVHGRARIVLYPHSETSLFRQHQNNWDLLKEALGQAPTLADSPSPRGEHATTPTGLLVRALRCAICPNWEKCYAGCSRVSL